MKYRLLAFTTFCSLISTAQTNSPQPEADRETSFDNYELLIIALLGLVVLMGLRFWFKRTRRK